MTIIFFTAIFAGLGISNSAGDYSAAGLLVSGVFLGSAVWWVILSNGAGFLKTKMNTAILIWVNRASGIIILIFVVVLLYSIVDLINFLV
jgi:hypothetical protein